MLHAPAEPSIRTNSWPTEPVMEAQECQKIARTLQATSEQRTVPLDSIPVTDLGHVAAVLSPAQSIGYTQRVGFVFAVARVVAVRATE